VCVAAGALEVVLGESGGAACPQDSKAATNVNDITENISNVLGSSKRNMKLLSEWGAQSVKKMIELETTCRELVAAGSKAQAAALRPK